MSGKGDTTGKLFRVAMLSLHTSPLAPLGRTRDAGGMNVYVRELARELGRVGGSPQIAVDIFTRRSDPATPCVQTISEGVRLITLQGGPAELLPPNQLYSYVEEFTRRVLRFALQEERVDGYDLIHSHYWLSALAGMTLARRWNIPHVTMFHTVERLKRLRDAQVNEGAEFPPLDAASATRIEYEGRIAADVERIVVSTEHEEAQLRRLYGLPASRFRTIPCGVDLDAFTPGTPEQRQSARASLTRLGLCAGAPTLLFVGRLDPIKELDTLLESVARMREPAQLVVVGGAPDAPGGDPEMARLRARSDALGIAARVAFPGAASRDQVARFYRAADALAVTSRYESFGLVAVEALACGLPVVASAVGGLPTVVRDGENGMLVYRRDPGVFAERFDTLLGDAPLRARLAANARPSAQRFGWGQIGDDVRAMYAELTGAREPVVACSSC